MLGSAEPILWRSFRFLEQPDPISPRISIEGRCSCWDSQSRRGALWAAKVKGGSGIRTISLGILT